MGRTVGIVVVAAAVLTAIVFYEHAVATAREESTIVLTGDVGFAEPPDMVITDDLFCGGDAQYFFRRIPLPIGPSFPASVSVWISDASLLVGEEGRYHVEGDIDVTRPVWYPLASAGSRRIHHHDVSPYLWRRLRRRLRRARASRVLPSAAGRQIPHRDDLLTPR